MYVLIVGSGAREHAIAAALKRSPENPRLICFGNCLNPGIEQLVDHFFIGDLTDIQTMVDLAKRFTFDFAIIGPEAPLEKGLADALWQSHVPTIGPKQCLAQIETSKRFARELMRKYQIPGLALFQSFTDMTGVMDFLRVLGEGNYVIKADGLAGGKGVKVAGDHLASLDEAYQCCAELTEQGKAFVIEEKLVGQEFSLMCFCDGTTIVPMPLVQDHKRAFIHDKGPNTGGMGSYSDADHRLPFLTFEDVSQALAINKRIIDALFMETNEKYVGILYGGFMATRHGVQVIEFNARFGDPEALNVLSILESDFLVICKALVKGKLHADMVQFANKATVCKYAVPQGYPDAPVSSAVLEIGAVKNKSQLYFAAVNRVDHQFVATHSRAAAYVGIGETLFSAQYISEKEMRSIRGPFYHREDIGTYQLIATRIEHMRQIRHEE